MKNIFIIIFSLNVSSAFAGQYCEVSLAHINPIIKLNLEKESNTYLYKYTFKNDSDAIYSIKHIWIRSGNNSQGLATPEKWNVVAGGINNNNSIHSPSNYIRWSSDLDRIAPSQEASGFVIKSLQSPGISIARFRTNATSEKLKYTQVLSGKRVSCPGVWEIGASTEEDFVRVMTLGPVMPNTISLTSYVRPAGKFKWSGSLNDSQDDLYQFSSLDKKDIEILIVSDSFNSIDEIDSTSIAFGRGLAKPLEIKKIKIENKNNFANQIDEKDVNGKSALFLTFKLSEVNPLCDLDRALFLTGKMKSGKDLFSGVSIKYTECSQDNWINEAKKILEDRPAEGH